MVANILQSGAGELWISWVRIWRKQHPDPGMVEASSDQVAENKRLQAELREAKMEIEFLKKAAAFFAQESR